jgi:hypothetical protein
MTDMRFWSIGTYVAVGVSVFVVLGIGLFQGLVAAIFPNFAARLVLAAIVPLILLIALMGRSDKPLNPSLLTLWLVLLTLILACWPSYMFFKLDSLPSVDGRKLMGGFNLVALVYLSINRRILIEPILSAEGGPLRVGLWLLGVFIFWRLASCFITEYPIASVILLLWDIVNYYVLFILGMTAFNSTVLRERFMMCFVAVANCIFVYVMLEWSAGKNWLLELAPRNENFGAFNVMLDLSRIRGDFFRAQGTFEHPLVLAEFAAMVASIGLAMFLYGGGGRKLIGLLTLLSASAAGYMSGSRVAFIAMGAGLLIVGLFWLCHAGKARSSKMHSLRKLFVMFSLIIAAMAAMPALVLIAEGESLSENGSTQARLIMLDRGMPSIVENPFIGIGVGYAGSVAGIKGGSGVGTLDNHLLAITIESGIPSLFLFLALLIYPVWRALVRLTEGVGAEGALLAGGAGALVAFSIVRTVLSIPYNQSFAFLISGMMLMASTIILPRSVVNK